MRARIHERLANATQFPVTLIVAPAGFGKSIALRDFIERAGLNAVRYDVRREDGTLLAFVRRLSETLEPIAPSALAAFPEMQERVRASDEPVSQLSDWFAEHLKHSTCTIVLDDLHYAAADPASIALLSDLIERTADRLKWIIAARSDVGLPVATWVAYGRMDIPVGEDDLRFTTEEALAAAEQTQSKIDLQEVEALRHLTEGWPVALAIALRTRTHSMDLRTAAFSTREMIYRYLAEQIFSSLTPEQRTFALASCVFSTFDTAVAQALGAAPAFLNELRTKTTFLQETSPGDYRYHDLFRDFLEAELRRAGETEWLHALCEAARVLYERGDAAGALILYTRAHAGDDVLRIIASDGFALFERGEAEKIALALDVLPDAARRSSAVATGLRAMIDASLGRFEIAQPGFLSAIDLAGDDADLKLRLLHRLALELVRLDGDCVTLLEPYAKDQSMAARYRAPILATLATGYLRSGRGDRAQQSARLALDLLDASLPDESRARVYQQAAFVERYAGSEEKARTYAQTSIRIALTNDLYDLAARAYSVLYTIARDVSDDPGESLRVLENLSECARKGASAHARLFALVAAYEIEGERGDDTALDGLERQMRESQAMLPSLKTSTVVMVDALRAAWNREFAAAHAIVSGTARVQSTSEQRSLRAAEAALYAAAAGAQEECERELDEAAAALETSHASSKHVIKARLVLALAHLVRGHEAAAHRFITDAERALTAPMIRMRALAQAVRTMYRVRLGQAGDRELEGALERLASGQFGGMARLLQALPAGAAHSGYTALTPAEREVLQLLAKGASTKDVAARTGRSPYTVDTHIRSICRKLSCSGRREAVALASSQGWVEA